MVCKYGRCSSAHLVECHGNQSCISVHNALLVGIRGIPLKKLSFPHEPREKKGGPYPEFHSCLHAPGHDGYGVSGAKRQTTVERDTRSAVFPVKLA